DSASKTDDRIDKLADQILNLVKIVNKQVITPVTAKAIKKNCVICGGVHAYYDCIATDSNQPSVCAATGSFFQNQASTSSTLPSNTVPNPKSNTVSNPKGEMKAVTTRSGLAYEGPSIPTNSPLEKIVERDTEEITDKEHSNYQGSTAHIQPPVVPILIPKPDVPRTQPKPNIPYPSRLNDQKLRKKATNQMEKFFQIFHDLHFDISFADALLLMPKFASTIKSLLTNKDKLFELAKVPLNENWIDVCYTLADLGASINLMPLSIYKKLSLSELILTRMTLELADRRDQGKIFIEEPPELELKELVSYLEYAFLEESDKLPAIIAKDLKDVEKGALMKVLKSHKQAIVWKISDIKGIDPRFYTHKILMEEDYKPAVQSQRRVNPKIHDVIKKEVIKLLDAGMIYPISDSLKLNDATRKDHFPLPFRDQMLERLAGNEFYSFLDGFSGIEVDRAKVDVIAKLPHPTIVKGVRSFLGHADCVDAFNTLKKKITEAPILVVPDWILPFELMCDASDFTIGAVLRQRKTKAQIHYTTTEKEMLDVVYAFEKFRPYLVLSKNKLDDALWAFRTDFKTPKGCTPYKLVYEKSCHLLIELEHRAYWALKHVNFDLKTAGDHRKLQLNKLNELRDQAHENSLIYKERTRKLHDSKIKNRIFNVLVIKSCSSTLVSRFS
nr:reverse transcriptase domain-containing protein [Tanacetum cinerariifolium]